MLWKTWPRMEGKNSFLDGVDTFRLVQGQMKVQQPCYNLCQSQKLLWCSFQINNTGYRINYFAQKTRSQKNTHTKTVKISVICVQKFQGVKNIWEGHFSRSKILNTSNPRKSGCSTLIWKGNQNVSYNSYVWLSFRSEYIYMFDCSLAQIAIFFIRTWLLGKNNWK